MNTLSTNRVACYIDGFNLYFGLKAGNLRDCYWLDVQQMANQLLRPGQSFVHTKYFTARITGARANDSPIKAAARNEKRKRQAIYLDALASLNGVSIYEGHYLFKTRTCFQCSTVTSQAEEKMTDVNIATELLTDAFQDHYDIAFLVSADSDLVPPIRSLRSLFPSKKIIVCFPPKRFSHNLKVTAHAHLSLWPKLLRACNLPDPVVKADGSTLARPADWC